MEDLRCIVDETFPSIVDHSLASHTSEILDNITVSSNLGLPVAASTEIRRKTHSHDRQVMDYFATVLVYKDC